MPLLVRDLWLRWDEPEQLLRARIGRALGVPTSVIRQYGIIRRAIDARRPDQVRRVYHVEVKLEGDELAVLARQRGGKVTMVQPEAPTGWDTGQEPMGADRPVIIGCGPAGIFAGVMLAELGYCPILLERGQDVPQRHKALHQYYTQGKFDAENNLLFGIGGAGAYSDGKLYSRTHDPRNSWVLETLVRFGADADILITAKPHMGSDKLPGVCRRMVDFIRQQGGEVKYGARVTDIETAPVPGASGDDPALMLKSIILADGQKIPAQVCLLGIGHSARDTYRMLQERGMAMQAKPFQMGVRIEHPQSMVNRNQYGHGDIGDTIAGSLGPAEYHLVAKGVTTTCGTCGPDLFSFCMCPGGQILPSNESVGEICTNGASNSWRNTPFANSGLVVTVLPTAFGQDPLAGLAYQQKWERLAFAHSGTYRVPAQRASDFLAGRATKDDPACSYPLGSSGAELRSMLPGEVIQALEKGLPILDRMIRGYGGADGIITAPETRASSPVRIVRHDQTRQSLTVAGLYPVGEGAGYAGGIVSSAADGVRSAELIAKRFKPAR